MTVEELREGLKKFPKKATVVIEISPEGSLRDITVVRGDISFKDDEGKGTYIIIS